MSGTARLPEVLPIVTAHPSFAFTISEIRDGIVPSDTFWVSCYKHGDTSVHGKVRVDLDSVEDRDKVSFHGEDGVEMRDDTSGGSYGVSCSALGVTSTPLGMPSQEYADLEKSDARRPQRITAFDVAPDKSQFATGFLDGSVCIYPVATSHSTSITPPSADTPYPKVTGTPYASSKPHLSTVTSLKFFPSSRVLLSAGADFTLHILPADVPSNLSGASPARLTPARSLKGHTRPITETGIIARGRNVISSSLDETVRLWDVASGQEIRRLGRGTVPIVAMDFGVQHSASVVNGANGVNGTADAREVETHGKVVACALQDGSFELYDLGTGRSIYRSSQSSSPLSAIAYCATEALLATGNSCGVVNLYDLRSLGAIQNGDAASSSGLLASFRRNEAGIEDLAFTSLSNSDASRAYPATGLAIATTDGLPYVADFSIVIPTESSDAAEGTPYPIHARVARELVGVDCDAVRCVRAVEGEIWHAGDDAVVRRYVL
ncbi:hypothetical protein HGRIS_007211 [Hohenbuehelia grisea]|uniref:WD40 repeat-like protein n=1 Tax=Hohenbuehelia grisea TaxID=104357 RepID=A0ABR3JBP8_9AGAR